MDRTEFVFIGMDSVQRAVDIACARHWNWMPAPEAVRRKIANGGHCVAFTHDDAPVAVVVAHQAKPGCGIGRHAGGTASIEMDAARFKLAVEDCPMVEDLVTILLAGSTVIA